MKNQLNEILTSLEKIPGTRVFNGERARQGYWLNQFAMSLTSPDNRKKWLADEEAYLKDWSMTNDQKQAVLARDYNRLIDLGGNVYFLGKIFITDGLTFLQACSAMSGMTAEDYQTMMLNGGRSPGDDKQSTRK